MSDLTDANIQASNPGIAGMMSVAAAFAASRDISLSRVSTLCFNDGNKLSSLQNGADIGTRRLTRAMQWFSDNWPEGAVWPEAIDRPQPEGSAAGDDHDTLSSPGSKAPVCHSSAAGAAYPHEAAE